MGKALKGFADAKKSPFDLLREVNQHVVAQGLKTGNEGREDHKIHVSELVKDACPRMLFYKVTGEERSDPAQPSYHLLESMWASGHQEHAKWQRWLDEMGYLWGNWRCQVCGVVMEDMERPDACQFCGEDVLVYDEAHLEVPDKFLVGHADAAVPKHNALVEVKSFASGTIRVEDPSRVRDHTYKVEGKTVLDNEGLWNSLKRPLGSHLKQGTMYLWMCQQMGLPYDRIIFIYENKATQKTKSFEIKMTTRHIEGALQTLEGVLQDAADGTVPDRPKLFAPDAKPCSTCVFKSKCWAGEESSGTQETSRVPTRGSRTRSEEEGGDAAVQPARPTRSSDPAGPRRRHRTVGQGSAGADDGPDEVDRAPRRATRDGRGGRALGRGGDGQGASPRFARRG